MPWNEEQLKRTLMIQRSGVAPNYTYRLHPYMRVATPEGETFLEPIPSGSTSFPHMGFVFSEVEFIEPPGSGVAGQGDTWLTRDTNEISLRP